MKTRNLIYTLILCLGLTACDGGDETVAVDTPSTPDTTEETINSNGLVVNNVSGALGSIATLATSSSSSINPLGGVATAYCSTNGTPLSPGGAEMTDTTPGVSGGIGYCQATFNAQSPDTARGSMYIAGGVTCEAARQELFDDLPVGGSQTSTFTITLSTDCWGTQAEVDAFVTDNGSSTLDVTITVADVSATTAYSYSIDYGFGTMYISSESGVTAGLNTSGWAFKFDTNTGTLLFEAVDDGNSRRNRMRINGAVSSDGDEFTAISSIQGFQVQSGALYTYSGALAGLLGDYYDGGAGTDRTNECYAPGSAGDCGAQTALSGASDTSASAQAAAMTTAASNLSAYTGSLIDFSTVDLTDTDITD